MPPDPDTGDDARLFAFEGDFVDTLRCIPMAVRLKLDRCRIKLSLRQWSRFTMADRRQLLRAPCRAASEIAAFRVTLVALIVARTGEAARELAEAPATDRLAELRTPAEVARHAASLGLAPPGDAAWRGLSDLERFALLKLSADGHDNANFVPALREFGLID